MKSIAVLATLFLIVTLVPVLKSEQPPARRSAAAPAGNNKKPAAPTSLAADHPWMREGHAGRASGGYVVLRNQGAEPLTITGVTSDVAEAVELHEMSGSDSMMKMRRVHEVAVLPQGQLVLAPGGLHLMFIGLTRRIAVGDTVRVTLTLAGGRKQDVMFTVRKLDAE